MSISINVEKDDGFMEWERSHIVKIGNRDSEDIRMDQKLLIWAAINSDEKVCAHTDSDGYPWTSYIHKGMYYSLQTDFEGETISIISKKFKSMDFGNPPRMSARSSSIGSRQQAAAMRRIEHDKRSFESR
jgi:hypothetical protein